MRDADAQSAQISRLYERDNFHERLARAVHALTMRALPEADVRQEIYRNLIPSREVWACASCGRMYIQKNPQDNNWDAFSPEGQVSQRA